MNSAICRSLGPTGVSVPPVLFGTAALGNVCRVITDRVKLEIVGEWFRQVRPPVFLEASHAHGDGAALEVLGRVLRRLDVTSDEVIIQLATNRTVQECWEKSCRLLGDEYRAKMVVVGPAVDDEGWQVARSLRDVGDVLGLGVVVTGRDVVTTAADSQFYDADYAMLPDGLTVMRHSPEMLSMLRTLASRQIPVILAGVFEGGFLLGGSRLDGRVLNPEVPADRSLLAWRRSFVSLCDGHGISPAHACIQFALSLPGVIAVRLDSTYADRVAENIRSAHVQVPVNFWASMKEEGLLSQDYPLPNS